MPRSLVHWSQVGGPFANVSGLAADERGNVWLTQVGFNRLVRVNSRGQVSTVAVGKLSDPTQLAVDPKGRILVADSGDNRIREITADGTISAFAGSGQAGYSGDSGLDLSCRRAPEIRFDRPTRLEADSPRRVDLNAEAVYVLDAGNNAVRQVRRFVDTSLPPPAPAAVCPQVMTFRPTAGTPAMAQPAHMAVAYGLGTLVSSGGSHDLFALGPSVYPADYSPAPSSRFTPIPSPAWIPGAVAANDHWDVFVIDTVTGQLHRLRYQVMTQRSASADYRSGTGSVGFRPVCRAGRSDSAESAVISMDSPPEK